MGLALPAMLPRSVTHILAIGLFLVFGVRLLKDAWGMEAGKANTEELEEVESELAQHDEDPNDPELGGGDGGARKRKANPLAKCLSPVFVQACTMTFLAEWGDRSQIATIALAAAKDPIGVTLGGILGHSICTGVAVIGGRMLATRISERTVAICGGVLFLVFALHSYLTGAVTE
jgi:putative Ca2+/H+ antiporter (TMEM165/GDT1 family)